MKVVQINAVCDFGSTGRIVAETSDFLSAANIDNYIAVSTGGSERKNVYVIGNKIDRKIHAFASRFFGKQGYFSYFSTLRLLNFLNEVSPDIVHLHNLHGNYINFPLLFDYLANKKTATVITLHDCFFYTGKCVYYSISKCEKWKTSCGTCPQLESGNKSWFFDKTRDMLTDKKKWVSGIDKLAVIGVSDWITSEAKQSILKNSNIIRTIYNWIDLDVFYPHESSIKKEFGIEDKYLILGVAISWIEEKGVTDFNNLADMLDDRFKIVLVGKTERALNKKILHIQRTDDIEMLSDLYSSADVFYNPTRRETFGKVTAEAMACGTPVIAYNTTACPELVNSECGYIEEIGDIEAVYNDIMKLAGNKEKYSNSCRKFAEDNFDKKVNLGQLVEMYEELLKIQ